VGEVGNFCAFYKSFFIALLNGVDRPRLQYRNDEFFRTRDVRAVDVDAYRKREDREVDPCNLEEGLPRHGKLEEGLPRNRKGYPEMKKG
jgi:hypothetical protein